MCKKYELLDKSYIKIDEVSYVIPDIARKSCTNWEQQHQFVRTCFHNNYYLTLDCTLHFSLLGTPLLNRRVHQAPRWPEDCLPQRVR